MGAFQSCSEISAEIETVEYREGGATVAKKSYGLVTIPDITLERGYVAKDSELYNLFDRAIDLVADRGLNEEKICVNMEIYVLDREKNEESRFALYNCLVKSYMVGGWDNSSSDILMTSLTLSVESWEEIRA